RGADGDQIAGAQQLAPALHRLEVAPPLIRPHPMQRIDALGKSGIEDEVVDIVDEAHPNAVRVFNDLGDADQTVVLRAKHDQRGRPPPVAADVVEAVEIDDMDRVAGRAEPLGHIEDAVPLRGAGPEADDIDDVELRTRRGRTIGGKIFDDCRGVARSGAGQSPYGADRQAAPAEFVPPLPGVSAEPDRGPRAPQPGTNNRLWRDDHATRLASAQHSSSGSAWPVTGSAAGNGTVAMRPCALSWAPASARQWSGLCPCGYEPITSRSPVA